MYAFKDFVFWSKNKLFRRKAIDEYKCSIASLKLSKDELLRLNFKKRKAIVEYAYANSAFYHDFYERRGFVPSQLRLPSDWEKVPVLEKEMLRENTEKILTVSVDLLRKNVTSGSTGEPLVCYHDSRFNQEILEWRMLKMWNVSPACDTYKIWRLTDERRSGIGRLKNQIMWFPTQRSQMDATCISPQTINAFLNKYNKLGGVINGYAGCISEISRYIIANGLRVISPKLIVTFASPITEVDRKTISQAFGTNAILDLYCCNEVSFIAFSCPESVNLHVNWDYRHIDIAFGDTLVSEEGVLGDVLITDLSNFGFPIIKYRLGDKSSFVNGDCGCGCNMPCISPVRGRISDNLVISDGGFVSGEWLTAIFDDYPDAVKGFQIRQKRDLSIELIVVPDKSHASYKHEIDKVLDTLKRKTGQSVRLIETDNIPTYRGKHRYVIKDL